MKTMILLISNILFLTIFTFGQQNKINQLDSNGKKDGKWVEYIDNNWNEVKDSTQAIYYRFTLYDHGYNIYKAIKYTSKDKMEPVENNKVSINDKKCNPLNGEYKWYDDKGRLITQEYYKNGDYIWCKSFEWGISGSEFSGKKLHEYFDYTKKFENQLYSFYYESYDKNGIMTKWYLRKDKEKYSFFEFK